MKTLIQQRGEALHELRSTLDRWEAATNQPTHTFDSKAAAELREKADRMEADLQRIEAAMDVEVRQSKAAAKQSALAIPQHESRLAAGSGLLTRESADYSRRWWNAVSTGNQAEFRALATSSSNAAVPVDMERRIVEKLQQVSVMRQLAVINTIDSDRKISLENALPSSALVAEAGTITPSDPTFSTQINITPFKYVCSTLASVEFLQDSVGIGGVGTAEAYIARKCGTSLGLKLEDQYLTGTGSSQPKGLNAWITQVTDLGGAAITTVTGDNIIDTVHLVSPQYRNSPKFRWIFSDTFLKTARKLKVSSSSNEYLWKASENYSDIRDGVPGTLYGVPYAINQYMPTATTNANTFAAVGNFDYFEIFDRTGVTSLMDPYSNAVTMQVALYFYLRTDCAVTQSEAFAAITC
jgi:HK97 family phage major capsid protein